MNLIQPRSKNGRFAEIVHRPSNLTLTPVDAGVQDPDPANRAAALMDPQCPLEDLEFAAQNDPDDTVRLCASHYVPEVTVNDENPVVRLTSYHYLGQDAAHDEEAQRLLKLIAA